MRKQITIPQTLNELVEKLSSFSKVSQSAVVSYALKLLSNRLASCEAVGDVETLKKEIKIFYKFYYIKTLPRGNNAKKKRNFNMVK